MAIFGKKKARSSSAGVFGSPAHPSGNLSPEAQAFLEAERSIRQGKTDAFAFPLPPSSLQAADAPSGHAAFGRRILARWFGKSSVSG